MPIPIRKYLVSHCKIEHTLVFIFQHSATYPEDPSRFRVHSRLNMQTDLYLSLPKTAVIIRRRGAGVS